MKLIHLVTAVVLSFSCLSCASSSDEEANAAVASDEQGGDEDGETTVVAPSSKEGATTTKRARKEKDTKAINGKPAQIKGKVTEIDVDERTVTVQTRSGAKTIVISETTAFVKGSTKKDLASLAVGDSLLLLCTETDGQLVAAKVKVGKPAATKGKKKKPGK